MKRVKSLTGVHLGTVLHDNAKPLADLLNDPIALVDVIFVLCKEQADRLHVSDEMFAAGLVGEVYETAADAFVEALIDFFPPSRGRAIRMFFAKAKEAALAMMQQAEEQMDQLTPSDFVSSLRR
jgi:hypothetical protein